LNKKEKHKKEIKLRIPDFDMSNEKSLKKCDLTYRQIADFFLERPEVQIEDNPWRINFRKVNYKLGQFLCRYGKYEYAKIYINCSLGRAVPKYFLNKILRWSLEKWAQFFIDMDLGIYEIDQISMILQMKSTEFRAKLEKIMDKSNLL